MKPEDVPQAAVDAALDPWTCFPGVRIEMDSISGDEAEGAIRASLAAAAQPLLEAMTVCEQHPSRLWPHDGCDAAGIPLDQALRECGHWRAEAKRWQQIPWQRLEAAAEALRQYGMEPAAGLASAAPRYDAFRSAVYRVVSALSEPDSPVRDGSPEHPGR